MEDSTVKIPPVSDGPPAKIRAVNEQFDLSPGKRIGPYVLVRPLGAGSFGLVWEAQRPGALATVRVALKLPRDQSIDLHRVRAEAEVWARIGGHPNILPITDADVYDGHLVLACEYMPDGSLMDWLQLHHGKAHSLAGAIEMMSGILTGLEYLHARNIVHRDLKPANILLSEGIPRLADFGLSLPLSTQMRLGPAGTPAYMAPEAFDGKYSPLTDLWSAAVIFYQLLTGVTPFSSDDLPQLERAIRAQPTPPLPLNIPKPIAETALRSLNKSESDRFRTAADMRASLRLAVRSLGELGDISSGTRPVYRTVAITGSMQVDPQQTSARITALAAPYISPHTTWYCGTFGVVDEIAAIYLTTNRQLVIAVGYQSDDISQPMEEILRRHAIPLVNAKQEPVPAVPNAPSKRDIYFATKADLVILIHDGKSPGTTRMLEWLRLTGKDHLVGYV